jgi:hypothetical protein
MHVLFCLPRGRHVAVSHWRHAASERASPARPASMPHSAPRGTGPPPQLTRRTPRTPHTSTSANRIGSGSGHRAGACIWMARQGSRRRRPAPGARRLLQHVMDLTAVGPCGVAKTTPPRPPIMLASIRPARRPAASRRRVARGAAAGMVLLPVGGWRRGAS